MRRVVNVSLRWFYVIRFIFFLKDDHTNMTNATQPLSCWKEESFQTMRVSIAIFLALNYKNTNEIFLSDFLVQQVNWRPLRSAPKIQKAQM